MDAEASIRYSHELAAWAATLESASLPASAIATARTVVLDGMGCALSGTLARAGRIAVDYARKQGGTPDATLIGTNDRVPAGNAAFANTMLGRIDLFDDADSLAHVHAGVATTMAALAVAQREDRDAAEFLAAVVMGVEVAVRIGMTMRPSHFDAGFHPTGTLNCFGTAAAAGRLMRFDAARMHAAFGLAAEQAAGLTEYRRRGPIEMSALHGARAAMSGILAADLANAGMPAPPTPLEGPHGLLHTMSPRRDLSPLLRDLGKRFAIEATELKPYPCNRIAHSAVGAAMRLRHDDFRFRPDNVRTVVVRMAADAVKDCDRPSIESQLEALYGAQYHVALVLMRGAIDVADFDDGRWNEPAVRALRSRVRVEHAPELDERYPDVDSSEIVAELVDGTVLRRRLDAPPGSPDNPMTANEIREKFDGLAGRAIPRAQSGELARFIATMDATTRMRALGPLLAANRVQDNGS
jgi:2-methylcitrate dehydratase PrpD